jgi:hypothetical protein
VREKPDDLLIVVPLMTELSCVRMVQITIEMNLKDFINVYLVILYCSLLQDSYKNVPWMNRLQVAFLLASDSVPTGARMS